MVIKKCVPVVRVADAMFRTARYCEERRGRTTVEVERNIVLVSAKLSRHGEFSPVSTDGNDAVGMRKPVEDGSDPVFEDYIDLGIRQELSESDKRRRDEHSVADRAQPNHKYTLDGLPINAHRINDKAGNEN